MTPRYRTAFSVPSGFAASAPATASTAMIPASPTRNVGPVSRSQVKSSRAEPTSDRNSAAA